jgi:hypothetical protein
LLFGAGQGLLLSAFGIIWTAIGERAAVDVHELATYAAMGVVGGVIIAFVLNFTRSFRQRGRLQDGLAWMLGGFVAAIVIIAPSIPSEGFISAIGLAILLGPGAGLGLFVFARQVKGDRW